MAQRRDLEGGAPTATDLWNLRLGKRSPVQGRRGFQQQNMRPQPLSGGPMPAWVPPDQGGDWWNAATLGPQDVEAPLSALRRRPAGMPAAGPAVPRTPETYMSGGGMQRAGMASQPMISGAGDIPRAPMAQGLTSPTSAETVPFDALRGLRRQERQGTPRPAADLASRMSGAGGPAGTMGGVAAEGPGIASPPLPMERQDAGLPPQLQQLYRRTPSSAPAFTPNEPQSVDPMLGDESYWRRRAFGGPSVMPLRPGEQPGGQPGAALPRGEQISTEELLELLPEGERAAMMQRLPMTQARQAEQELDSRYGELPGFRPGDQRTGAGMSRDGMMLGQLPERAAPERQDTPSRLIVGGNETTLGELGMSQQGLDTRKQEGRQVMLSQLRGIRGSDAFRASQGARQERQEASREMQVASAQERAGDRQRRMAARSGDMVGAMGGSEGAVDNRLRTMAAMGDPQAIQLLTERESNTSRHGMAERQFESEQEDRLRRHGLSERQLEIDAGLARSQGELAGAQTGEITSRTAMMPQAQKRQELEDIAKDLQNEGLDAGTREQLERRQRELLRGEETAGNPTPVPYTESSIGPSRATTELTDRNLFADVRKLREQSPGMDVDRMREELTRRGWSQDHISRAASTVRGEGMGIGERLMPPASRWAFGSLPGGPDAENVLRAAEGSQIPEGLRERLRGGSEEEQQVLRKMEEADQKRRVASSRAGELDNAIAQMGIWGEPGLALRRWLTGGRR